MPNLDLVTEIKKNLSSLLAKNDLNGAIILAKKFLEVAPNDFYITNVLAVAYFNDGQYRNALVANNNLLKINANSSEAHYNKGLILSKLGDPGAAATAYKHAISLAPKHSLAHNNLANIYMQKGDFEAAKPHLKSAIDYAPNNLNAYINLSIANTHVENFEAAIHWCNQALAVKSHLPAAHKQLGKICSILGKLDEAKFHYQKTLESIPDDAQTLYNLVMIEKQTHDSNELGRLRHLARRALSQEKRKFVFYSLGKSFDDLHKPRLAFHYFRRANELRKAELGYDVGADETLFEKIQRSFSQKKIPNLVTLPKGKKPVFIVGMPRSGSTLIEQILASHSEVYGANEFGKIDEALTYSAILDDISSPKKLGKFRDRYLEHLDRLNTPLKVIVDKSLLNFRWVGFLVSAFPNCKIINVRRDKNAIIWSNYKHYFEAGGLGFTTDVADLRRYHELYEGLMAFWDGQYDDKLYHIDYEQLVSEQSSSIRRMISHIGLEWDPACLLPHLTERAVKTASLSQVREKIYANANASWRAYEQFLGSNKI